MAKGKAKNNNSLSPPQPRSLRSRKRECPSDEIPETDDVQATLHHQDTEGINKAADDALLQCPQAPLQESTVITAQPHQSCLTKQEPVTEEKHAEATNEVTVKAVEVQEETVPNSEHQLKGFRVHSHNHVNKSGEDMEETAEECNRSPSLTCTDQLQVFLPTCEKEDGSYTTALGEQPAAKESSQCHLKRNQETSHEAHSNAFVVDDKEITKEAAAGLPAKKKRRMGMCGLTEKERTHFLQTQKRENGQSGPERVEKQICKDTADLTTQEEMIRSSPPLPSSLPIPGGSVTEQTDIKLQSSHSGGDDRAVSEVRPAVMVSAGTSTVSDPGCSEDKSEEGILTGPEQTGDTKSDLPAEEREEKEQQELEERAAKIMDKKPEDQIKQGEDGSAVVDQSPTQNVDLEAAPLQVNSATRATNEKKEELTDDAGAGASSLDTGGGFNGGSVELCEASLTPSGTERNDSCDAHDEPGDGPSPLNADLFGSGYLDFVSDSQLNTIALTEEEDDLGSADCYEATDLMCGLITELSSLNRKVMATHRELEILRRSSKSSRSSIR
ncbi:uncharacterized protein LOC104927858 [Larimichthys crocea]|uniref:uncharacterized protein LOC104927858 n=1 Tax=Larimichthys crocea TaxID=215358 RepID=UPI000F5FBD4F|nr:uncharacterized protein LOC104927858 [Larimichthys crocea]XP_019113084.2 uncharacterized protein LOC104927858 [Larimichthys crocea]